MGTVLTTDHVRAAGLGAAYPDTSVGNAQLDERIVALERWLAKRIGPLLGPISVERLNPHGDARIRLLRPVKADTIDVTLDAVAVSDELYVTHTRELVLVSGNPFLGRLVATYDPDDEYEVREALLRMLQLELSASGMQSENISGSGYSYTRGDGKAERSSREAIVAELLPLGAGIGY